MNIALFGGTFDPIHSGHIKAAEIAARKFRLDRILFCPTGLPPHKPREELTPFNHRFAMVALACAHHPHFVPTLLESPNGSGKPHYSIQTVRRALASLSPDDHLYFLIGADAFLDLPHWHQYRRLLDLVDLIVVSRPGFGSNRALRVIPEDLRRPGERGNLSDTIPLRRTTIHILRDVKVPVASSDIRRIIRQGAKLTGSVPRLVEQYILKEGLYCPPPAERHGE